MGKILCKAKPSVYDQFPHLLRWKPDFDALMIVDADLEALYECFCEIDEDGSGEVDLMEMIRYLDLQRSKFNRRIFTLFDEDDSGEIDFREFVVASWNYCTMSKTALTKFAFDLYDDDGSGAIDMDEMERCLKEVYGKEYKRSENAKRVKKSIQRLIQEAEIDEVSLKDFNEFCDHHPGLLFPAFKFQIDLQREIVGAKFWARASDTRVKLTNGMNVSVQDILKARVNMQTFEVEQYASSADVKSINTIKVNQNGRVSRSSIFDVVNRNSNSAPNVQSHYATKSGGFDASTFRKSTGSFAERRAAAGIFSPDAKAKIRSVGKFQKLRRAGREGRAGVRRHRPTRGKDLRIAPK